MFLKSFKNKSIENYLNKLLSERHVNVNDKKIESLGIILNIDELSDFELFRALGTLIKVHPNRLKIITYSSNEKDKLSSWDVCFNPKDFGWKGLIKNLELQSFVDKKFDALISYYTSDELELKLITASSKAQLKIGILQTDERVNDLIIKTKLKDFKTFKSELLKYLTILNKIENEE